MRQFFAWMAMACLPMSTSFAQTQLPNVGFENWQNASSNTAEPTNWNSNETGGGFATWGPQTCFRSTTAHTGTYSAELRTLDYLGNAVNGSITTGRIQAPSTNPSQGYIETVRTDANFNAPFTGRPDSLVGYYIYTQAGSDRAKVEVILHGDYNVRTPQDAGSTPYVIGTASFLGPQATVGTWTRFSVPFTYVNGNTPMYALAVATSSSTQATAVVGSKLWIDDLQVIYNPTIAVSTLTPNAPYYVSAATGASTTVAYTVTGTYNAGNTFTLQLSDASGSFASPTTIGSIAATTSGNINATIPAGTPTGGGYRMRIVSSNPAVTSPNNGSDLQVYLCTNSTAPAATQVIAANTNGTALSVTEAPAASSREWKMATSAGGPYSSFAPAQTGTSYTPNFAAAGSYFLVCTSTYPGGLSVTTNEVRVDVVANAVTPSTSQSILAGANGNLLTVTESPAGTAREWKFATVSGGPYSSFGPAQTGATYTPNFAAPGTYYVVCQSTISGLVVTSNEVEISVGSVTITTNAVTGSPFEFSASAPNSVVSVPFTVSGTFNAGNTFTAQLSDASGSFASPTNIGTLSSTTSGTISAIINSTTPDGANYRIRVVSSNPAVSGSDNGTDLVVDQFSNSVAPAGVQNTTAGVAGTAISVTESQSATRAWRFSTTSGSGYTAFTPTETAVSYTPLFAMPGTYYVVCASTNQFGDEVVSNEVEVIVGGGTDLTTTNVTNSPYLVSQSANVQALVDFTSNAVFNNGNVFSVQLSDQTGSFANPLTVGSLAATAPATITATIPNNSISGSLYRMRVVSSDPALIGTDNGVDLEIVQFEASLSPVDSQFVVQNQDGTPITVTTTHSATVEWKHRPTVFIPFQSFTMPETGFTYTPNFATVGVEYLICEAINTWGDTVVTGEVVIIVDEESGVENLANSTIRTYFNQNTLIVDASQISLQANALVELYNTNGQMILQRELRGNAISTIETELPTGVYALRLVNGEKVFSAQLIKR